MSHSDAQSRRSGWSIAFYDASEEPSLSGDAIVFSGGGWRLDISLACGGDPSSRPAPSLSTTIIPREASFRVTRPSGIDYAYFFSPLPSLVPNLESFIGNVLFAEGALSPVDSRAVAAELSSRIRELLSSRGGPGPEN